ncbi:MAG: hypothetical protein ABIQ01_04885 [Pseudolysinimonas sp.]
MARKTDDFYGQVEDTLHLAAAAAADELGVSVGQIYYARRRMREGRVLVGPEPWSEDEDALIMASADLTAKQLTERLSGRTYEAVRARRLQIGAPTRGRGYHAKPTAVAGRPLIAKTCRSCGELQPGDMYLWRSATRTWHSYCIVCTSTRSRDFRVANGSESKFGLRQQEITLPTADRRYLDYTDRDMAVLTDQSLTVVEKALTLHRTYFGTAAALERFGLRSAMVPVAERLHDSWKIDNPNEDRVADIRRELEGANR